MNISRNFVFGCSHSLEMNGSSGIHPGGYKSSCQPPGNAVGEGVGDVSATNTYTFC